MVDKIKDEKIIQNIYEITMDTKSINGYYFH
jgi:hypothetical protein